ncbi:hypothetical protein BDQ12DRAFT_607246 [Crucibulum laeve]|uniref:Uncharacterized protein n=1 Tax=Crucibulum laeve TaxID=68775 RepID=A0A5C3LZH5_9AGAR|nr:hypothetical protein BDQ12DRAFT_607246 [Crucibulum laeve]
MDIDADKAVQLEAEATEASEAEEGNDGRLIHDQAVVKTLWAQAIDIMEERNIVIDSEEEAMALTLFPWVAGLAWCVHDSPTLKEKFDKLVSEHPEHYDDPKQTLD